MKLTSKRMVSLGMAALMAGSLLSVNVFADEQEEKTLTVWFSDAQGNEKNLPEDQWTINKYARSFEEENPGVKVDIVFQGDQGMAMSKLKADVASGTAPDIVNLFGGYMITSYKDILTDITDLVPEDDLNNITGWESVRDGMKKDGAIYGYPEAGNELGVFLYNKELCEKAGVDITACKDAQEFKDAVQKIKDAGITPILCDDGGANGFWMFGTGAWWTQMSGSERVLSNSLGTTKFAEDQGFIDTLNFAASFYSDGLMNEDYATSQDSVNKFLNGDCALYPCGNWDIAKAIDALGDNVGVTCVPSFDGKADPVQIGGVGQAWAVVNTCENPDLAVKFLSYVSQKDYVISQVKASGKAPQRSDITLEELGWAGNEVYEKVYEACKNCVLWNDNSMQTDVANEYYKLSGMVIIGQMTAEECAEQLDEIAAEAAE